MWGFIENPVLSITSSGEIGFWEHDIEASKMQGRARGRKGERKTHHITSYHHITMEFRGYLLNVAKNPTRARARKGEAQGVLSYQKVTGIFDNPHVSSVVTLLLCLCKTWSQVDEVDRKNGFSPSGSRFWCLSWSGILVFLKAESIKLMNFSRISFCETSNSKPPSKAPCHRFALPTTGRPWSARGMKMPNCLACALNMCPQIWNSEVVGFPRVPVFSSNWKPKIIPALLFTLLFPVFQNQFLCHLSISQLTSLFVESWPECTQSPRRPSHLIEWELRSGAICWKRWSRKGL